MSERGQQIEPAAILDGALDLLRDPEHWCQDTLAEDAEGIPVEPESPDATRWCLSGAVWKVRHSFPAMADRWTKPGEESAALQRASQSLGFVTPVGMNDNTDHDTVLRCLKIARDEYLPEPS